MTKDYSYSPHGLRSRIMECGYRSVDDFARSHGIHRNTLYAYLNGAKSILSNAAMKIAESIGVDDPLELAVEIPMGGSTERKLHAACKNVCEERPNVVCMLIGSRARGNSKPMSDYDVAFSGGMNELGADGYLNMRSELEDLIEDLPLSVDIVNLDGVSTSFLLEMNYIPCYICGNREAFAYFLGKLNGIRNST